MSPLSRIIGIYESCFGKCRLAVRERPPSHRACRRFRRASDVYARYERMKGNDVLMVSGTDEHGTPILVEAEKED